MAAPELPPASKQANSKMLDTDRKRKKLHITIHVKSKQRLLISELTTEKTLISNQLTWHGKSLNICWFIPHVNTLHRLSSSLAQNTWLPLRVQAVPTITCSTTLTHRSVQHCRDEVISDALHFKHILFVSVLLWWFNQNGAFRVHSNYLKQKTQHRNEKDSTARLSHVWISRKHVHGLSDASRLWIKHL